MELRRSSMFAEARASVVLPIVGSDLRKAATLATEKPKKICDSKSVHQVEFEVVEGDARNVLCEAVEKHRAAILVVSSHGYGALKRFCFNTISISPFGPMVSSLRNLRVQMHRELQKNRQRVRAVGPLTDDHCPKQGADGLSLDRPFRKGHCWTFLFGFSGADGLSLDRPFRKGHCWTFLFGFSGAEEF
ncbi:hypothetical protein CRG98_046580 [Punica granatum]|uniref:UspA domain-containing protein n=1 Tax=Punica granatum TaxID=22663 RepID=A0A2I0HN75_PUNGR|nr:hypothetical protein CRG98_046580 [Punica granatum]